MPILIKCIEDGCLAARNGGSVCDPEQCSASRMRTPATRTDALRQAAGRWYSSLPEQQQTVLDAWAEAWVEGRDPSVAELAAATGVDEDVVHQSKFALRRIVAEIGSMK